MSGPDDLAPSDAPLRTVGEWLEAVEREERRGELLAAYDIADRGLEQHPHDTELGFRSVLALARTGSTNEAERRFADLRLATVDTEDVTALAARIRKDQALAATGAERQRLAAAAAAAYRQISEHTGGYFPAINAATLSLVAGDALLSRTLAADALTRVDNSNDGTYYAFATRAEAQLLLGDPAAARVELERAARAHNNDFGAVSTTRRQLRMICAITGVDANILTALSGPAVAHYCGHLIAGIDETGRFHNFDETDAKARIAQAVADRPAGFAYGSLASGGDILWAEALLEAGCQLHVVMPFALDEFLRTSVAPAGPEWVARFHACLEAAQAVTYATDGAFLDDEVLYGYCSELAMGLALLRARFLDADVFQFALWDGTPPTHPVGTAIDVATWRQTGHDVVAIAPLATDDGRRVRSLLPETHPDSPRVVRTLLIGDVRGFSKLADDQLPVFFRVVMGAFADVLARYGAPIEYRNTWGDALIAVMTSTPAAARCALELQEAMASIDLEAAGLPPHLAYRLSGHVGPVFSLRDPVLGTPSFTGSHVSRTARIEPVTPPGAVYVTEAFAAALELADCPDLRCDYVGHMPTAKDYGRLRMYHLRRAGATAA